MGGTDISLAEEKREREGRRTREDSEHPKGKRCRIPAHNARIYTHTRAKRDERDERVGELIRRQECRPEETPTTVLYSFPDTLLGSHGGPRETSDGFDTPSNFFYHENGKGKYDQSFLLQSLQLDSPL